MTTKRLMPVLLIAGAVVIALTACKHKPTDAEIKSKVEAAVASYSGIAAEVKDAVVTLSGEVPSADLKTAIETAVNALTTQGVKSVVSNIQVVVPPPPVINPDDVLLAGVKDATKDFPNVKVAVSDSVITVTGTVEKSKVKTLKQSLDALRPKKVDMKGLVVK
jgi:hyperosmotically inducible protein